ncbi:hypothetical protein [Scytonema sp. PCC 10023]|uniref:hypothetical protein n=1 Tax=Scytonema sp. PCC 10023 TaxID=1680591 RepID=UPI0039C6160F
MLGFSFLVVGDASSEPALTPATKTLEAINQLPVTSYQLTGSVMGILPQPKRTTYLSRGLLLPPFVNSFMGNYE